MLGMSSPMGTGLDPKKDIVCAVCHRIIRGRLKWRLYWCNEHRHYVCPSCWDNKCLIANLHEPTASHPVTTIYMAYTMLIIAWFTIPLVGVVIYGLGISIQSNGLEAEPIGSLSETGTVKILGTVNSTRALVALGGTEHWFGDEYGGEWKWDWNTSDIFWLEDTTGRLRVDCSGYFRIEDSHHKAPNAKYSRGTAYFNKDTVYAVGTIQKEGSTRVLRLQCMYPSDAKLELPLFWTFLASICIGGFIDAGLWWWYCVRQRTKLHALATADVLPSPELPSGYRFERDSIKVRKSRQWLLLATIIGGAIIATYILITRPHSADQIYWLGLVVAFSTFFPWVLSLMIIFDAYGQ